MPMDFFAAQDDAHSKTKTLIIYFVLAVVCIIASLYLLVMVFYSMGTTPKGQPTNWIFWSPVALAGVGGFVVLLVGGASLSKIAELKGGGGVVAKSVGGRKVDPGTADPDERKLMNVVEEMAIASGTPVPEVYLLDQEQGINGFAAGYTPDDAAIAVTRGCVQNLSRDELQGVIAHEFSHILNGDMRMNIRLMGVLFGIMLISIIGNGLMRAGFWGGAASRSRDKSGNAIMLFGLGMMAIGGIGVFFGRLIQSAISREREYLADASAVQFTRNPDGIGGALKKIGGAGSVVNHHHASETAHFFFANALKSSFGGAFATHPPLPDRIQRIEPNWDGKMEAPAARPSRQSQPPPMPAASGRRQVDPLQMVAGIGAVGASQLAYAQQSRAQAEAALGEEIHSASKADALILALLLDRKPEIRQKQIQFLELDGGKELADAVAADYPKAQAQGVKQRIPLLEMTLPALSQITRADYDCLIQRIVKLSEMDEEISFFEFAVMRLVKRHLGRKFDGAHAKTQVISSTAQLREPFSVLLSTMVWVGEPGDQAQEIFQQAVQHAPLFHGSVQLLPFEKLGFNELDKALDTLTKARFGVKRQILAACATAVAHDGEINDDEGELIRAVAVTLDCPMPPLV